MANGVRIRMCKNGSASPYERALGVKPREIPQGEFGQLALIKLNTDLPKNSPQQKIEAIYLGPEWKSKQGCIFLNPSTGRLIVRRDYQLMDEFPFQNISKHSLALSKLSDNISNLQKARFLLKEKQARTISVTNNEEESQSESESESESESWSEIDEEPESPPD